MKIKGKEIKEYKTVQSLAKAVEESLDDLALTLQTKVVDSRNDCGSEDEGFWQWGCYKRAEGFSVSVWKINEQFGTDYEADERKLNDVKLYTKPLKKK